VKGDELDDAIDAVVREIMRTEPPAGLRARVMGQLSQPERRVFLTMPRLSAAAAVFAVCVLIGLVVTRDGASPSVEPTRTGDVASSVARATDAARPVPEPPQSTAPRVIAQSRGARRLPTTPDDERVVSAMSLDEPAPAVAIAPLRPMPATTAAPIESEPVLMPEIAIHPLAMDPVRVDLLPSPPR